MVSWIWLNPKQYPDRQETIVNPICKGAVNAPFAVAEFRRTFPLKSEACSLVLRVSGDAAYRIWVNEHAVGQGPPSSGGDFLCDRPCLTHYAGRYELSLTGKSLRFFAQVRLKPEVLTEYSKGHGGFFLEAEVLYQDGSRQIFGTDSSWEARYNGAFVAPCKYDGRICPDAWCPASEIPDIWQVQDAPIPMPAEEQVLPTEGGFFRLEPMEEREWILSFHRIYAAYLQVEASGSCELLLEPCELLEQSGRQESVILGGADIFRSFSLHSCGHCRVRAKNLTSYPVTGRIFLTTSCYPVTHEGWFSCSDPGLTKVYELCKWTLRICRQTLHLDSPRHQELLACTGDYFIEAMMTAFTFGDMRLAALDVRRTALWLVCNNGVMFHTSYSLIWVQMLRQVWLFTGDDGLLEDCAPALEILLNRFSSYIGENGVIDHPPDYMFVDWLVTEGYSMHHPPKSLGQTVLNAFYYKALIDGAAIFRQLGRPNAEHWQRTAAALKDAFNTLFYDPQEGLYKDGLPDPVPESKWQPANPPLRHFSRHSNTLAALYGLCSPEDARRIMRRLLDDRQMQEVQPYFMHFVLDAVAETGLFPEYGIDLLRRWIPSADECGLGLAEGWYAPEAGYSFDHSHAWGGTPAYQLPARMLGFRMVEPGFRRISLNPQLMGLSFADIAMPTPYGLIRCQLRQGEPPKIQVPDGIQWSISR